MTADLDAAKYVSFVTYKKDGSPVAAPVWVVPLRVDTHSPLILIHSR